MGIYTVGIDVGGTNTDVVLVKDGITIASAKVQTTEDITTGITHALENVLRIADIDRSEIRFVKLGTTHLLNEALQNKLSPVAVIRLGFPATTSIPPCTGWPKKTVAKVIGLLEVIEGGFDYDRNVITELNPKSLKPIADMIIKKNIELVAITGVFAHLDPSQEILAARLLNELLNREKHSVKITLSHHMGGLGLLERENATILNASLLPTFQRVCEGLLQSIESCGLINAKAFLSHNDGTVQAITLHDVYATASSNKPISTINAGQMNSMVGAALIAAQLGVKDVMIADIGGTSTDIGRLKNALPAEASFLTSIAKIPLKLETADGVSIALGGGSLIQYSASSIQIGPESVGSHLKNRSISFGGNELTATDIAVYRGRITDPTMHPKVAYPDESVISAIDDTLHEQLASSLSERWHSVEDKPRHLILVGGGSKLFDSQLLQEKLKCKGCELSLLTHEDVCIANALGAAFGEIAGTFSEVFDYQITPRLEAHEIVKRKAIELAVESGADRESVTIKSIREEEIAYVNGTPTILAIKVSGKVRMDYSDFIEKIRPESSSSDLVTLDDSITVQSVYEDDEKTVVTDLERVSIQDEISARALGSAFLGSGGGGDTRLVELMLLESMKKTKLRQILPLDSLSDDATVVSFGVMGSPSVLEEKIPSKEEMQKSILAMQAKLGRKIDAIVTLEIGGLNGLMSLLGVMELAANELDIQILDADCMGRAFPGINMATPTIYQKLEQFTAVIANCKTIEILDADNPKALEEKAREATSLRMGGLVSLTYLPMTGKTAKEVCIPGTLSIAKKIGEAISSAKQNNRHILEAINHVLANTDYEGIKEVFSGRIESCRRIEKQGFSVGGITIKNQNQEFAQIIFQNENLLLRKCLAKGYYQELEITPNLIVVVDRDSLVPISCAQLRFGQHIRVLTIKAPKQLLTPEALAVVGPKALQLDKLCELLDERQIGASPFFDKSLPVVSESEISLPITARELNP